LVAAGVARHEARLGNVIEDHDSDFERQYPVAPSVALYDRATHIERISSLLDELEARNR
jgi:hypothetical protein